MTGGRFLGAAAGQLQHLIFGAEDVLVHEFPRQRRITVLNRFQDSEMLLDRQFSVVADVDRGGAVNF